MEEEDEIILNKINKKASGYDGKFKNNETISQKLQRNKNVVTPYALSNDFTRGERTKGNYDLTNSDYMSGYENPETQDLNELRSTRQGGWGELGAGTGRVVSKVGREILKTAGAVVGTAWGLAGNASDLVTGNDNTDLLKDAFDNSFIRAVDENFEKFNNAALPVYVSDAVTNGGFFDKVTSGEFWATEGADGAGYLISAFAPGAALKALGASNKLFGGLTKLTSMRYGKSLDVSRRALAQAGITVDKIDSFVIPAANTFFEAGAESKGVTDSMEARYSEFEETYPQRQLDKLKEVDARRQSGEISIDEANQLSDEISNTTARMDFDDQKSKAARNTFLTNLLILAGPNYIQSKILYGKNGATNLLNNVSRPNAIKQAGRRLGESFLTEGSEEVGQTSTEGRNAERGLRGELSDTFIEDVNPLTFGRDFIKSLGTTEGQVAGFLGGVLGAPISIVQGHRQDSKDKIKSDKLRGKIETTGLSLNDIHLPIYKTEIITNPETGEETEVYSQDAAGKKVLIPENVAKVKQALDLHEEVSKQYDDAVDKGDVEAIDRLKKYGEHELIMSFVSEDEMTIDALKEHLKVTMPTVNVDAKTATDNLKRQNEIIDKAKYLQKELVLFKDMSTSIIKLNNPKATPTQVQNFMNGLANEFIKETSEIYDNQNRLNELNKTKSNLEKFTTLESIENVNYDSSKNEPLYENVKVRVNPRLDLVNNKIKELKKELSDASSFLDYGIWNSKIVNGAFNEMINSDTKLEVATSPEVVQTADDVINAINSATTLDELNAIDRKNNPGFTPYYTAKKTELEAAKTTTTLQNINQELAGEENDELEAAENTELVKSYTKTSKVGNIELNPFTLEDAVVTEITKNSITLTDVATNESFTYEFEEDINDNNSADDIDPTKVSVIAAGTTHSDHKSVGYDNNNPSFADYLMEARDKTGDVVTFELNELNVSPEGKKAIDIIKDGTNIAGNRQLLIDTLPINFVYNNGQGKSWSAFKGPNAVKLRANIVDAIINGAKLSELKTVVTNQESASFNTKFENGKPVVNNPLEIDFIKTLDEKNPENKVTLYHVNAKGDLVIVSNNKLPLPTSIKSNLTTQKGQIFIVLKNPKGVNVPVKLNFSKLNATKASTLARLYSEILADQTVRSKNLISLKSSNVALFNEILSSFKDELVLLGNNPATINIGEVIQSLVHEDSMNDKAITFTTDIEGNSAILFDGTLYNNDNIDEFGVALQNKYHNVITIAKEKNANENLSFKNPIYLKYLFDNGIVSTNLNTDGFAFKQFTDTKAGDKSKNTGSELWISSVVESTGIKTPVTTTPTIKLSPVEKLRAEEQIKKDEIEKRRDDELKNNPPLFEIGHVSLDKIQFKYDTEQKQLYAEYDKLISPLLKAETKPTELQEIESKIIELINQRNNDRVVRKGITDSNKQLINLDELDSIFKTWNDANGLTELLLKRDELNDVNQKPEVKPVINKNSKIYFDSSEIKLFTKNSTEFNSINFERIVRADTRFEEDYIFDIQNALYNEKDGSKSVYSILQLPYLKNGRNQFTYAYVKNSSNKIFVDQNEEFLINAFSKLDLNNLSKVEIENKIQTTFKEYYKNMNDFALSLNENEVIDSNSKEYKDIVKEAGLNNRGIIQQLDFIEGKLNQTDNKYIIKYRPGNRPYLQRIDKISNNISIVSITKKGLIKSKITEYNKLVSDILSKRKEGQDSIKGPDYMLDKNGNLIQGENVIYTDEGIVVDGSLETFDMIKELISETIENNYDNILKSQKNVVSLPTITLTNTMNTPGTQDNLDYKKAFNNLKVEGDNLLLQEGLERTLNVAVKNAELFKTTNPSLVPKFEKIISETTTKLIELADTIKKQQKC